MTRAANLVPSPLSLLFSSKTYDEIQECTYNSKQIESFIQQMDKGVQLYPLANGRQTLVYCVFFLSRCDHSTASIRVFNRLPASTNKRFKDNLANNSNLGILGKVVQTNPVLTFKRGTTVPPSLDLYHR